VRLQLLLTFAVITAACGGDDAPTDPDAAPPDGPWPAPVIEITSHIDGDRVLGARTISLAGVIDSWAPIDSLTVTVNGGAPIEADIVDATFSAEVELDDGANAVAVLATSAAGEGGDDVDLTYPFITLSTFEPAGRVLGQASMTTNVLQTTGSAGVSYPYGRVAWSGSFLYAPSSELNRVLGFPGFPSVDGAGAFLAIGQPDFDTTTAGSGAGGVDFPQTVGFADGRLYVLDYGGSRVMGWSVAPTGASGVPADFVIGQADLDTTATGCARDLVGSPDDFFVGGGKLLISDTSNHRVLVYDTIPTANGAVPDLVLGQGDFVHCGANDDDQDGAEDPDPSARSLKQPTGVWTDGVRLFVADFGNHRVLIWNSFPTTSYAPADLVLGQIDFTSNGPNNGATGLDRPISVTSNGNQLFVGDDGNNRVLVWNAMPDQHAEAADVVLGQSDFVHTAGNDDDQDSVEEATPTARTLNGIPGVEIVAGTLAVTDIDNHRILFFGPLPQ
jgi:hypothetical protein